MKKYSPFFQCFQKLLVPLQNCTFLPDTLSQGYLEQILPIYLNCTFLADLEFCWHFYGQEKLKFKRTNISSRRKKISQNLNITLKKYFHYKVTTLICGI